MLGNKIIVVFGGSGLIGKATVDDLRKHGAIVLNADINVENNIDQGTIYCDITHNESILQVFEVILKKFGNLDGVVNNAYPRTSDWGDAFENVKYSSWETNVGFQLNSCFFICQKALEIMKQNNQGSLVNVASIYGIVGNDFTVYEGTDMTSPAAYSAIKGGIINFTRYLASYYGKHNLRVNCVSPGGVFNNQNPVFVKNFSSKVPLKRLAEPDDIAPAISFLLSEGAKYVTGHNLVVDGGWTAI